MKSLGEKKWLTFLFDFVVGKLYCSPRHDHFMGCWNYTEAGTRAFLPCPDIPGFAPDRKSVTSLSKNRTVIYIASWLFLTAYFIDFGMFNEGIVPVISTFMA